MVAGGSFGAPTRQNRLAFMRYVGQGHEIPVTLPERSLSESDVSALRQEFDAAYARFYDRPVPGSDVEVMSYAVTVTTVPEARGPPRRPRRGTRRSRASSASATPRRATRPDGPSTSGPTSAPDGSITGPAIVAEAETSTLIGPGWSATVDERGYLDLRRIAA